MRRGGHNLLCLRAHTNRHTSGSSAALPSPLPHLSLPCVLLQVPPQGHHCFHTTLHLHPPLLLLLIRNAQFKKKKKKIQKKSCVGFYFQLAQSRYAAAHSNLLNECQSVFSLRLGIRRAAEAAASRSPEKLTGSSPLSATCPRLCLCV